MKSIVPLIERKEAHAFVRGLWRTGMFRGAHDRGSGLVYDLVERFADTPAFFFERSDRRIETPHFSAWWGGIQLREEDYESDAIHDLYYLHEIYHKATMPYAAGLSPAAFAAKMQRNELEASVCSEIAIYFDLPGLRDQTFKHPIYADRFLRDLACREAWLTDRERLIERFRLLRHNVMVSDRNTDPAECWIRQYARQNDAWAGIWSGRYDAVEAAMVELAERSRTKGRGRALKVHMDWLASTADGGDNVPFLREASAFSEVYWQNKVAVNGAGSTKNA